jgi:hypothetical protein
MASKEEIEAAIEKVASRGETPTVRNVYDALGKRGSFSQIGPAVRAWHKATGSKSASGSAVPDKLTEAAVDLVAQLWALAEKKALDGAQDARRGADLRNEALVQDIAVLEESLEEMEVLVGEKKRENDNLAEKLTASESLVLDLRGKVAGSAREIALLRERIADITAKPTSKRPKHAGQANGTKAASNPT